MSSAARVLLRVAATGAVVIVASVAAGCSLGGGAEESTAPGGEVALRMVTVGSPGNASVGVVSAFGASGDFVNPPAHGGIYKSCSEAPPGQTACLTVGGVDHTYEIGELEVTVAQYVAFLNTVDPNGTNPHDIYLDSMSPTVWPKYGSIAYAQDADAGEHYSVAIPRVGGQAVRIRRLPARRTFCQLPCER